MALIHWWPLKNGLQDMVANTSMNSGIYTKSENGIMGSCLKNTASGCMSTVQFHSEWSNWKTSVSMGCWVKINYAESNAYIKTLTYSDKATHPTGSLIGQTSYGGLGIYWRSTNQIYNNGNALPDLASIELKGYCRGSNNSIYTNAYTIEYDKLTCNLPYAFTGDDAFVVIFQSKLLCKPHHKNLCFASKTLFF